MACEPRLDRLEVRVGDAEISAEFVGSEEFMVVGRGGVLHRLEIGLQLGFLVGAPCEDEEQAAGGHGGGRKTPVKARLSERMCAAR